MQETQIDFDWRFRKACDGIIQIAANMNSREDYREEFFENIIRICDAQLRNFDTKKRIG